MRSNCLIVLIAAVTCLACKPAPDTRDDAAVLRAAFATTCGDGNIPLAVISDSMANRDFYSLPPAWSAGARYWRQLHVYPLETAAWPHGPICANVRIVAHGEIDTALAADPGTTPEWSKFYEKFHGARGYAAASRPIYSSDGLHALVFMDHHCEGHCGLGEVIELERADGRWREIRRALTWIS
jgi:hypothetical protein